MKKKKKKVVRLKQIFVNFSQISPNTLQILSVYIQFSNGLKKVWRLHFNCFDHMLYKHSIFIFLEGEENEESKDLCH